MKQRTLKDKVLIKGKGLHTGEIISLQILPAEPNTGIVFSRTDVEMTVKCSPTSIQHTPLCTKLVDGEHSISTIEHLMFSLAATGIDNAVVLVDGAEIPIMDGSAASFVMLIKQVGIHTQDACKKILRVIKPVSIHEDGKCASITPANKFTISFSIEFDHPAINRTVQSKTIDFNSSVLADIAKARTFGFLADIEYLQTQGLVRGGSMDNAIVLDDYGVMNTEGLRSDSEFVDHKILDAIGDLYVTGYQLVGHVNMVKSGHSLNNKLLLKAIEQGALELVTLTTDFTHTTDFTWFTHKEILNNE